MKTSLTPCEAAALLAFLPNENSRIVLAAYFRCPLYKKPNVTPEKLVEIVCSELRKTLFRALNADEGDAIAELLKVVTEHPAEAEAFAASIIAAMARAADRGQRRATIQAGKWGRR